MSKFKRENQLDMEVVLVASCSNAGADQNLATGALVGATTALGISNGQLGVMSWDFDGTVNLGTMLTPGTTAAQVNAIKVVQGTPASSNTTTADPWEAGHKAYVESDVIYADNVRSVAVKKCKPGKYGAKVFVDLPTTITDSVEYGVAGRLDSVRNQRDYGRTGGELFSANVLTLDYTALGTVSPQDHLLQNLVFDLNRNSKATQLSNPGYARTGNGNYMAFGINSGGGAGQAIGTITCGTVISFINDAFKTCDDCENPSSGITSTYTADISLMRTLACIIDENANNPNLTNPITSASTIELVDLTTAGSAANVDSIIIVGLPHTPSVIDNDCGINNDMYQVMTRVDASLTLEFQNGVKTWRGCQCFPEEAIGSGEQWYAENAIRWQKVIHNMQSYPSAWHTEGQKFIDRNSFYTSYIIDYFDYEETMTVREQSPKQLVMLFCCNWDCAAITVNGMAVNLAASNPDMATITNACCSTPTTASVNTVPDIVATLDAWLISIPSTVKALGDATLGGPYLIV